MDLHFQDKDHNLSLLPGGILKDGNLYNSLRKAMSLEEDFSFRFGDYTLVREDGGLVDTEASLFFIDLDKKADLDVSYIGADHSARLSFPDEVVYPTPTSLLQGMSQALRSKDMPPRLFLIESYDKFFQEEDDKAFRQFLRESKAYAVVG